MSTDMLKQIGYFANRSTHQTGRFPSPDSNQNSLSKPTFSISPFKAEIVIEHQKMAEALSKSIASGDTSVKLAAPLINTLAKAFLAAPDGKEQDAVHNPLISHLINGEFKELPAAKVMQHPDRRKENLGAPLYQSRNQADLNNLPKNIPFIRDFVQVQSTGGSSALVPLTISGLVITDQMQVSDFQKKFDDLVEEINRDTRIPTDNPLKLFEGVAHRDAIQLIPYDRVNPENRISQFYGDVMQHVLVTNNQIHSKGALQGIFATDGVFRDLQIVANKLQTNGDHIISISGMLSGRIDQNTDLSGTALTAEDITLHPLRLGGDANHLVMSFNNPGLQPGATDYFAYEAIGGQALTDLRTTPTSKKNATNWYNSDTPTSAASESNSFDTASADDDDFSEADRATAADTTDDSGTDDEGDCK